MAVDQIFAKPRKPADFTFNAEVADVFADMINRSVPGYSTIVNNIGILASNLVDDKDLIYDLGCSLGAVSISIADHTLQSAPNCKIIAVDNSKAMIDKCLKNLKFSNINFIESDILDLAFEPTKLVVLNFTLQFIKPNLRFDLLTKIYQSLQPNGALIIAEKVRFADVLEHNFIDQLHINFKCAQGYSELEIAQKRNSIEKILIPNTSQEHIERLQKVGFSRVINWFHCFNFAAFLAIK